VPRKPKGGGEETGQVSAAPGEVYIEYKQVGQTIKVTAVDAATGLEVVIMGPASAAQSHLQKVAVEKLKMQLKKTESEPESGEGEESRTQPPSKGWTA